MGARIPDGARLRALKSALVRASRFFASDQVTFNHEVLKMVEAVELELAERTAVEAALRAELADLNRRREYDHSEIRSLKARLGTGASSAVAPAAGVPSAAGASGPVGDAGQDEVEDFADFYREFEDEFRGSPELIRARQMEFIPELSRFAGGALPILDIGCGRGEWLKLLREHDIPATGVDINATFVGMCTEQGLDAHAGDAVAHLRSLPEGSLAGVTAFHVAEHLPTNVLMRMIDAAHHAVAPGGVIVLETPSPLNITVGAANFWSDLTHLRPLYPASLAFLVRQRGFVDVELRFLHPTPAESFALPQLEGPDGDTLRRITEHLNGWFFGPEDYAVVGHRAP